MSQDRFGRELSQRGNLVEGLESCFAWLAIAERLAKERSNNEWINGSVDAKGKVYWRALCHDNNPDGLT
jgi:hypothetical protein